jgi:homoserine dehydrogenase
LRIALVGYGNVGRAFARLLEAKRSVYPFRIVGIMKKSGAAYDQRGLPVDPLFGPRLDGSPEVAIDEFLNRARPEVVIEISPLEPETGEPAISYIRGAFLRHRHVITANKGPIAHAYADLNLEAKRAGVEFRFESTVMDGAPVFNLTKNCLPGCRIHGFKGVLNSTTKVVINAMRDGRTMQQGIAEAQAMGIAETDASYDIDGWDSAAKVAALANVILDARTNPKAVDRTGIGHLTTDELVALKAERKTVCLVSRGRRTSDGLHLSVKPEVLPDTDLIATLRGTSNFLLFETDLMGEMGMMSIDPGVEQTAYGLFSDLVDIARSV